MHLAVSAIATILEDENCPVDGGRYDKVPVNPQEC